ncbi:hypothetical protein ACHWQZ_G001098 [Mnemiopsis leidyi]
MKHYRNRRGSAGSNVSFRDLSKRDGDGGTRRRVGVQVHGRQSSTGPSSSASSFSRSLQPIGEKKATVSFASVVAGVAQERKKISIGANNESPARKQSVWKSKGPREQDSGMSGQASRQEEGELLIPCYQLSPYPSGPQNLDDRKYDEAGEHPPEIFSSSIAAPICIVGD